MKKVLFMLSISTLILSCNRKDEKFCDCLAKSEEFNDLNHSILNGKTDQITLKKAIQLKKEKQEICQDYIDMDGAQMLARKKECK